MAKVQKTVATPGVYHTLSGLSTVSAERLRHWHDTVQALIQDKIFPPVVWGHQNDAVPSPDGPTAARYTAGRVLGSHLSDDGSLSFTLDVPGTTLEGDRLLSMVTMPDGRKLPTAIDKVSIGARDWTDGRGRQWKDAPIHLALTPLPVMIDQPGFEPSVNFGLAYFSLDQKQPAIGPTPVPAPMPVHVVNPPKPPEPVKPEKPKPDGEKTDPCPFTVPAFLDKLRRFDIRLPTDTNEGNLLERLWVALAQRDEDPDDLSQNEQPVTEESGIYLSTMAEETTTPAPVPPPTPPPAPDPRIAAYEARFQADAQKRRLDRVDALAKRGLKPPRVKALKDRITATNFALDEHGQETGAAIDDHLDVIDDVLPKEGLLGRDYFSGAVEEPAPEQAEPNRFAQIADEAARNSGLGAANRR